MIIAKVLALFLCQLPLNTIFLSLVMSMPYLQLLLYRCAVLIPFGIIEVLVGIFVLKLTEKIFEKIKKQ